jgi:prevent-host-death family protein
MPKVNVAQAKAKLSELIDAALRGEEVVIARRNKPVVKLEVVKDSDKSRASLRGMFKGKIWTAPDFDDPLPEEWFTAPIEPPDPKPAPRRKRRR